MVYTNSPLVAYTKLSPNHSGQRTHTIDRISPHCIVGQLSIEDIGAWFAKSTTLASSNYAIGADGRVGMYVEECNRSWCTSSNANDQRAVTIECASDKTEPYWMNDNVYQSLIKLCTDICRRNGKKKLIWFGDKDRSISYNPKSDEMVITVHRWFANKSCPGDWLYSRLGDVAAKVTAALSPSGSGSTAQAAGLQAASLAGMTETGILAKVAPLFEADYKKTGILASVSMAQFILESDFGRSELARNANNCFGMKALISANSWSGGAWDGKSRYTKETQEQDVHGNVVTITADFRKYACIEDSIADHSAYLLGAKKGTALRYDGLKGELNYVKAVQIIKDGGYATDINYVPKLCNIIGKYSLYKYDDLKETLYRVRKTWTDEASQIGAYTVLDNAKAVVDKHPGYSVYDASGTCVYEYGHGDKDGIIEDPGDDGSFSVRVKTAQLAIRKEPTIYSDFQGHTGVGTFTIVKVQPGDGSSLGWGQLKSGAGWVSLDFCERV